MGRGRVSSKSLMSNSRSRSGDANSPKLERCASPQSWTVMPLRRGRRQVRGHRQRRAAEERERRDAPSGRSGPGPARDPGRRLLLEQGHRIRPVRRRLPCRQGRRRHRVRAPSTPAWRRARRASVAKAVGRLGQAGGVAQLRRSVPGRRLRLRRRSTPRDGRLKPRRPRRWSRRCAPRRSCRSVRSDPACFRTTGFSSARTNVIPRLLQLVEDLPDRVRSRSSRRRRWPPPRQARTSFSDGDRRVDELQDLLGEPARVRVVELAPKR